MNKTLLTAIALLVSGSAFAGLRTESSPSPDKCQKIKMKKVKVSFKDHSKLKGYVLKNLDLDVGPDGTASTELNLPVSGPDIISHKGLLHCKRTLEKHTIGQTNSPEDAHAHKKALMMLTQIEDESEDSNSKLGAIKALAGGENNLDVKIGA